VFETTHSEFLRKLVHVSMAGFALLLRWIPWWCAALLAGVALLSTRTWIPRKWGRRLMRPEDQDSLLHSGITLYALAVLLLILIFRHNLEVAACAWGVLAFGDGAATLLGGRIDGPRLVWNRRKSWIGSAAFLLFGTIGGAGLLIWVGRRQGLPGESASTAFLIAGCACLLGSIVESLPLKINDNLSVPLLAGGVVFSLQKIDPALWHASAPALLGNLTRGVFASLLLALAARSLGAVSWSGVAGGVAVGTLIATFAGLSGFAILTLFFVLGSAATRIGYVRKAKRGIAQERGGARGFMEAVANCGVAAYLAFLAAVMRTPLREAMLVAFVASLATAACDTLGTEVGPLGRGEPFLITDLRRVPRGTPGAVSLLGTAAGTIGALGIGAVAAGLGLISSSAIGIVVAAALVGTLLESVLAATLEPDGLIGSETMNFVNTLAGALAALSFLRISGRLG